VIGNPLLLGDEGGYNLTRSLRFRSSASAYLNRTFGTPTNNIKWTWSGWIKRGKLSGYQRIIGVGTDASGANQGALYFDTSAQIGFFQGDGSGSTEAYLATNALYRDPAAWYHITFVYDSANATSANRLLMYVNGVQVTSFASATYPSSSLASKINANGVVHAIGVLPTSSTNFFDGYMAEVNFIDGQALTPSSFGAYSIYNQWLPKKYAGTYGTNGFYLPFTNNASAATLGNDFSGNSNTWTTNNISVTAGVTYDSMTDVPTLTSATAANYAVMNPLNLPRGGTLSNGNLLWTAPTAEGQAVATMYVSAGKFYWEMVLNTAAGCGFGIADITTNINSATLTAGSYIYFSNGNKYNGGTGSAYGATFTSGDIIGVALDLDAGTLVFYKNNTSQGTAFTGLSGNFTALIYDGSSSSVPTINANFGQQPFTYTPPSGFLAINTFNL